MLNLKNPKSPNLPNANITWPKAKVINYVAKIIVYINSVVVCLFIDVVVQVCTQ